MKVFSPSQTVSFLECPVLWSLNRTWLPRKVNGPRDFGAILGRGFSVAMATYNEGIKRPRTPAQLPEGLVDRAVADALSEVDAGLLEIDHSGRITGERDLAIEAALRPRVEKAVRKAIAQDPIPEDWYVEGIECSLGEQYGWAKPDLIVLDPRGRAALDYKVKLAIRGKSPQERQWNRDQLVDEYERSWQMYHYSWALHTTHYYIVLVTLEPSFTIELLPYEIDPESLDMWKMFAVKTWERMEAIEEGLDIPVSPMLHVSYGQPCDCQKALWTHHLDPILMQEDYVLRTGVQAHAASAR